MAETPWILVVEDDDALRRLLATSLKRLARVETAAHAEQALDLLRHDVPPRVVITDVMMPGTSGVELTRTIRRDPRLSGVPIVMLSAKNGTRDVVDGINAGVRHYVTKPFKSVDLFDKVSRLMRQAQGPLRSMPAPPLELEIVDGDPIEIDVEVAD